MAKWGEGDPRWQVEEREDGTNANNWHWTEKKATTWSTKKLTELLVDLSASTAAGEASLSAVDSITGDCCANQRKGKLIFFYELVIKMKWKGKTKDGTVCNGTLSIPNLSEEYCDDMDDIQVDVTLTSDDTPERRKVKDIVRKDIAVLIREQLTKWYESLKKEYAIDLIKPSKSGVGAAANPGVKVAPKAAAAAATGAPAAASKPAPPATSKNVTISLSDEFRCRGEQLFRAILTEDQVRSYTQSECKIDAKTGGEFSMFGGNITGVFKEVVPHTNRNSFVNLALPMFQMSEPMPPAKTKSRTEKRIPDPINHPDYVEEETIKAYPEGWTAWDKFLVDAGDLTVQELNDWFKSEHSLLVQTIVVNAKIVYNSFMPSGKKRLPEKLSVLAQTVGQVNLEGHNSFMPIMSFCDLDGMTEVETPDITYKFR